jgi:endonuclease V-like protein UPF0215 family
MNKIINLLQSLNYLFTIQYVAQIAVNIAYYNSIDFLTLFLYTKTPVLMRTRLQGANGVFVG